MVLSTRISVLHRILVPRSEVRLLGGQQKAAQAALIVEVRTTIKQKQPFPQKRRRVMEYTVLSNTNNI